MQAKTELSQIFLEEYTAALDFLSSDFGLQKRVNDEGLICELCYYDPCLQVRFVMELRELWVTNYINPINIDDRDFERSFGLFIDYFARREEWEDAEMQAYRQPWKRKLDKEYRGLMNHRDTEKVRQLYRFLAGEIAIFLRKYGQQVLARARKFFGCLNSTQDGAVEEVLLMRETRVFAEEYANGLNFLVDEMGFAPPVVHVDNTIAVLMYQRADASVVFRYIVRSFLPQVHLLPSAGGRQTNTPSLANSLWSAIKRYRAEDVEIQGAWEPVGQMLNRQRDFLYEEQALRNLFHMQTRFFATFLRKYGEHVIGEVSG